MNEKRIGSLCDLFAVTLGEYAIHFDFYKKKNIFRCEQQKSLII